MARLDLRVPYADKDEAKRLGACWDATARVWYVPAELDASLFDRWLPPDGTPNVRAARYFIAASTRACWQCGDTTAVHGFMLPAGYETIDAGEDPELDPWETGDEPTLLAYLEWLAPTVAARVTALTPHYRLRYSRFTGSYYWMNQCEHCAAPLGDHETCCEPGAGFLCFTLEDARRVTLTDVGEPFAASCGSYTIGVTLFRKMRRL